MTIAKSNEFNHNYLSKEFTLNIKGIFVILIIFSHFVQYVQLGGTYDDSYLKLQAHLNQMVVAMFLFYSGYGIMKSIQNKGTSYADSLLAKRLPKLWCNFAAALSIFLIVDLVTGRRYSLSKILLSYVGWESIGNSNWYIFDTFILYILAYLAFRFLKSCSKKTYEYSGCTFFSIFTIIFVYILMKSGREAWWYNTVIIFPFGCWYALLQHKIEKLLMKNDFVYTGSALLLIIIYCISFLNRWKYGIEGYTVWALSFTFVIVMFSMKVSISSKFLSWFGNHVFSIYVLQRIPMIVLSDLGFGAHKYIFLTITFVSTIFIAMLFDDYICQKINTFFALKRHGI